MRRGIENMLYESENPFGVTKLLSETVLMSKEDYIKLEGSKIYPIGTSLADNHGLVWEVFEYEGVMYQARPLEEEDYDI